MSANRHLRFDDDGNIQLISAVEDYNADTDTDLELGGLPNRERKLYYIIIILGEHTPESQIVPLHSNLVNNFFFIPARNSMLIFYSLCYNVTFMPLQFGYNGCVATANKAICGGW